MQTGIQTNRQAYIYTYRHTQDIQTETKTDRLADCVTT